MKMLLVTLTLLFVVFTPNYAQDRPLTCAIVFDGSRSLGADFASVKEAGRALVAKLQPKDECVVVRFVTSDDIKAIGGFTSDRATLLSAIEELHTDYGRSAIVDAVYVSVGGVKQQMGTGRVGFVVVVTDGDERSSFYKSDKLFEMLRANGVRVYPIGLTASLKKGQRGKAEKLLARIAEASGGRAFFPLSAAEMPGVATDIVELARR